MTTNTDENPYGIKDRKLESVLQQISIYMLFAAALPLTFSLVSFVIHSSKDTAAQLAANHHISLIALIIGLSILAADIVYTTVIIKRGLSEPLPDFGEIAKATPGIIRDELGERRK